MKCTMDQHDFVGEAGHDWTLVPAEVFLENPLTATEGLLWACPCGEFKWTSYAEWEKAQGGGVENSTTVTWSGDNNSPAPRA